MRCFTCRVDKSPSEFQSDPSNRLGLKGNCKECLSQYQKRRRVEERARVLALEARYRNLNQQAVRAAKRRWEAANPAWKAAYRADPATRLQDRARASRNRARRKAAPGTHTAAELLELHASYLGICVYCGGPADTTDHIVPIAAGGSNGIENLVPACERCNKSKKDRALLVWLAQRAA